MKLNSTENAATNSPRGRDGDTENSCTSLPVRTAGVIPLKTASGDVTTATSASSTPDRNSLLSAAEAQNLARIARERREGWMVSVADVDFLLDVIGRMG